MCKLLSRDQRDYVNIAELINEDSDVEILLDFMLHLLCERRLSNPAGLTDINLGARRLLLKVATRTPVIPRFLMVAGNVRSERDLIGSGGFGHVFKGELQGAAVALKVLYKSNHNIVASYVDLLIMFVNVGSGYPSRSSDVAIPQSQSRAAILRNL